jgi:hypothetical protein
MSLPRILPIVAAVGAVVVLGIITIVSIKSMGIPNRCEKVSSNIVFLESGNLITLGEEGVVCAYNLQTRKWVELAYTPPPAQNAPTQ